jgi:urea transport system substrate-binding protein
MVQRLVKIILLPLVVALGVAATIMQWPQAAPPIRIAALHSLSGTMAVSERPLVDALRLAVEEINAEGGLLGRRLELVVADGASDPARFASEAERLITQEQVSALFACWTSTCRKAVLPVVEQHNHLMVYPVQYEGLEQSPNILYTGASPNQQIIPGTLWAIENMGKRVYLLGSDYIFPRTANTIIRDLSAATKIEIVGERYTPLGANDFTGIVEEIRQLQPDVVLNTINGESNYAFLNALKTAGLAHQPVISFSVAEGELAAMGSDEFSSEHYVVWSYFQSLPGEANQLFIERFRQRFGVERVVSDPILTAYMGVKLWANAVSELGTTDPLHINIELQRQSLTGPNGVFAIDAATRHLWRQVHIGKARHDGQFDVVFSSSLIRPAPFPGYRSMSEWLQIQKRIVESVGMQQ